ncbi:MAG: hypothetical protein NC041_04090 [Bacteroides sp.]|nr:hypothetical protein [Prevotella sp.]MCM1407888.1 hypothetical protein [Treponema brennaborense]MCM1469630.1 hypothetical protein [Bacteroides sp.]
MTKKISIGFLILLFSAALFAAPEVNRSELESAGAADSIVFINYAGPHAVINTIDEIREIGAGIGRQVSSAQGSGRRYGAENMYSVIHAVDPSVKNGLDADIIIIGRHAGVDHIRNLREIIASYLTAAYGYSSRDASTLAVFVTVYNAVHRGDLNAFNAKYKPLVCGYLSAESAGLSVNYEEWPGNTQIVVPLSDSTAEGLGAVDTSVISDRQVVESMRGEDGRGIEERKEMVDIKEREADKAAEQAQAAQKNAAAAQAEAKQEQQRAEEEQQKLKQAEADAEKAQAKADEASKKAAENPNDPQAQAEAKQAQSEAKQAQQAAEQQKQTAAEQEKKAEEAQKTAEEENKTAAEQQAQADKKRAEAQDERKAIAKDQNEIITEKAASPARASVGLRLVNSSEMLSALILFNPETGKTVQESPVNVIRGRTILPAGEKYAAIAGKSGGNGNAAIKLVLIDTDTMEIAAESAEIAAPQSALVSDGSMFYAVVQNGSSWVVGKYNAELKLQGISAVTVLPETPLFIQDKILCVTAADNTAKILNISDLKEIK